MKGQRDVVVTSKIKKKKNNKTVTLSCWLEKEVICTETMCENCVCRRREGILRLYLLWYPPHMHFQHQRRCEWVFLHLFPFRRHIFLYMHTAFIQPNYRRIHAHTRLWRKKRERNHCVTSVCVWVRLCGYGIHTIIINDVLPIGPRKSGHSCVTLRALLLRDWFFFFI